MRMRCKKHGTGEKYVQNFGRKTCGEHLEDLDINRKIILKCALKNYGEREWIESIWVRIMTSSGFCEHCNERSDFVKGEERLPERLSASHEGLCYIGLISRSIFMKLATLFYIVYKCGFRQSYITVVDYINKSNITFLAQIIVRAAFVFRWRNLREITHHYLCIT
jgi:hypothetical protein